MLILKMVALHAEDPGMITSESFSLFGIGWFVLADFIPRALPSVSFMIVMQSRRNSSVNSVNSVNGGPYGRRDQVSFAKLATEDDGGPGDAEGSLTQPMLTPVVQSGVTSNSQNSQSMISKFFGNLGFGEGGGNDDFDYDSEGEVTEYYPNSQRM
jgi:hypothetical protein